MHRVSVQCWSWGESPSPRLEGNGWTGRPEHTPPSVVIEKNRPQQELGINGTHCGRGYIHREE